MPRTHKNEFLPFEQRLDQPNRFLVDPATFWKCVCTAESQLEHAIGTFFSTKSARASILNLVFFGSGLDSPKNLFWPSSTAEKLPSIAQKRFSGDRDGPVWAILSAEKELVHQKIVF